jgi:hypothetical protein
VIIVARRGLGGVDVARNLVTRLASSGGIAGRVLSTLGASTLTKADIDDALWSLKIWLAASTLRGRREEDWLVQVCEIDRDTGGGMGKGG